jgi:hypothetical protein
MMENQETLWKQKLVAVWLAVAVFFGGLLALAEYFRNRLDDPDPAQQRPGYLLPAGSVKAPNVIVGFPRPGRRLIVFFVRSVDDQLLFHDLALQSDLAAAADVVLVTPDGRPPRITDGLSAVIPDNEGQIAHAYGLSHPLDGGYPVGYALVDGGGFLRYQTLDPHCVGMGHNYEVKALLRAIR